MAIKGKLQWLGLWLIVAMVLGLAGMAQAEIDVSTKVQVVKGRLAYDRLNKQSYLDISLKNISQYALLTPIKVIITTVTPATVTVVNADGTTAEGMHYLSFTTATGQFLPGETIAAKKLSFANTAVARFTYTMEVLATIPEAPVDQEPPVPDMSSLPAISGECSVTVLTPPTATDALAGPITGTTTDPLTYATQGPYAIAWTYDDGNGNTSSQVQNISVDDLTAPVPDLALLPLVTEERSAIVSTVPTATDNCSGSIVATTSDPISYSTPGEYTITWTYDDGNGNLSTQQQVVRITDSVAPVPDISPLPTITEECSVTVSNPPTATDTLAGAIIGTTTDPLTYANQGSFAITWTYDDGNGNTSNQVQNISVDDLTAPVPDLALLPLVAGEGSATVSTVPTATDNCSGSIVATTSDPISYSTPGEYTITWTYDDGNGNLSTQQQIVSVTEIAPPPDDSTPPRITVTAPVNNQQITTDTVGVYGYVNEAVSELSVNGVPAILTNLSFAVYDLAVTSCEYAITIIAKDLAGNTSQVVITIMSNNPSAQATPESSYLVGRVYEADSNNTPISSGKITVEGICGSVMTDSEGHYAFPVSGFNPYTPSRSYTLTATAEGYARVSTVAEGRVNKEELVHPLYLTRIDAQVTTITSADGGVAENSRGNAQVVFPPGAASADIDVSITMYDTDEQLPAPLPSGQNLYAIGQFEPEGTVFNVPVLVRLPNTYNLPPGTALPCVDYDPLTRTWNYVDDGIVSADGLFVELQVQHFSWYGAVWVPTVDDEDPEDPVPPEKTIKKKTTDEEDPEAEDQDCGNSTVSYKRGNLRISHKTATYRSMGLTKGLSLQYDSSTALPNKVVSFSVNSSRTPNYTKADIFGLGSWSTSYFTSDDGKKAFLIDAKDRFGAWLPSGMYSYGFSLTNYYNIIRNVEYVPGEWTTANVEKGYTVTMPLGAMAVNNQIDSPFGSGWQITGLKKLINETVFGPIILDGSGKTTRFENMDYWIDTVAGGGIGDTANATQVSVEPKGVAIDTNGNTYIADSSNHRIRKIDSNGIISTVAGIGSAGFSGDNGEAVLAALTYPEEVAVDLAGNLYIADRLNQRIRKVDTNGIITTVAGTGIAGFSGDGGVATAARLNSPYDIEVDAAGNLYIADYSNSRIRKVDTNGIITTIAGKGSNGYGGDGGLATEATLWNPSGVALDANGAVYISDRSNDRIRKVDHNGIITTVAGNGIRGFWGDGGPATDARINLPSDVIVDGNGNLFIADFNNNRIRKVDTAGTISTVAGSGNTGFYGDGFDAVLANIYRPEGVALNEDNNLLIADTTNKRLRMVDLTSRIITTMAGNGLTGVSASDGIDARMAQLSDLSSVEADAAGNLYFADKSASKIYKVDAAGILTTIAGNGTGGSTGDNGPAVSASLNTPEGIAIDASGNLYFAEYNGNRIRKVDTNGTITTVAGTGTQGFSGDGGAATSARLFRPADIAVDKSGNIFIADSLNHRIRKVDTQGIITTVAGSSRWGYSGDGGPATQALLAFPTSVEVNSAGEIFVADKNNNRIRKIDANGIITTFAGTGGSGSVGVDGSLATATPMYFVEAITLDSAGDLYVGVGNRIIKIDKVGFIWTVAGGKSGYAGDDGPALQASLLPKRITRDSNGNIFFTDIYGHVRICSYHLALAKGQGTLVSKDGASKLEIVEDKTAILTDKSGVATHFDSQGNQIQLVDRNGNATAFEYDELGHLLTITDSAGLPTKLAYGLDGMLDSIVDPVGRKTLFEHDIDGNLTAITDPDGSIFTYTYDDRHLLTSKVDPRGYATTYNFNAYGQVESVVSATGETRDYAVADSQSLVNDIVSGSGTKDNPSPALPSEPGSMVDGMGYSKTVETDAKGAVSLFTNQLGNSISYERDEFSRITRKILPNGAAVSLAYDESGNVISRTIEGLNATTSFTYTADFHRIATITNPLGAVTSFAYDSKGNLISATDGLGNKYLATYNTNGLVQSITDPVGRTKSFVYNQDWDLVKIVYPDLTEARYTYDATGNISSFMNPKGNVMAYQYDEMNRVVAVTDSLGGITRYGYESSCNCPSGGKSNLTSITDAGGRITRFTYNEIGQPISMIGPLGETEYYTYDQNRNLVTVTDAKGQVITFTYDAANRLISKTLPDNAVVFSYDSNNNLTSIVDNDSGLTFERDLYGRLVEAGTVASSIQPAMIILYDYDIASRLVTMVDPLNGVSTYDYDVTSKLIAMTSPDNQTFTFGYNTLNRRIGLTFPNSTQTNYGYDTVGRLRDLTSGKGSTVLSSYSYTYDQIGNISSVTDLEGIHTYGYDVLDQLINATHPVVQLPQNPTESYAYDLSGNRTSSNQSSVYSHDGGNRLLEDDNYTYGYDASGNMVSWTNKTTAEIVNYAYDAENQLIGITASGKTTTYAYDPFGRRIEKNVNGIITRYIYAGSDILLELDGLNTPRAYYTHGPLTDEHLLMKRDTNHDGIFDQTVFYLADALGSTTALTDENGSIVQRYLYDSYGNIVRQIGNIENPYTYTGRETDSESGLYYYRNRYYDPTIGRFINEDPIGMSGGLNLYRYVRNNPINFSDPWGLKPGDRYDTVDEAAINAIKDINQRSIKEGKEYGGYIREDDDNKYFYDKPTKGCGDTVQLGEPPIDAVADYHTHGSMADIPWKIFDKKHEFDPFLYEDFSLDDKDGSNTLGMPGYLGTPLQDIKVYEPDSVEGVRPIVENYPGVREEMGYF